MPLKCSRLQKALRQRWWGLKQPMTNKVLAWSKLQRQQWGERLRATHSQLLRPSQGRRRRPKSLPTRLSYTDRCQQRTRAWPLPPNKRGSMLWWMVCATPHRTKSEARAWSAKPRPGKERGICPCLSVMISATRPADADTSANNGHPQATALFPTDKSWEAFTAKTLDCEHSSINDDQRVSQCRTAAGYAVQHHGPSLKAAARPNGAKYSIHHGTFIYIYYKNQPHGIKYTSPMDPMPMGITGSWLSVRWLQIRMTLETWVKFHCFHPWNEHNNMLGIKRYTEESMVTFFWG